MDKYIHFTITLQQTGAEQSRLSRVEFDFVLMYFNFSLDSFSLIRAGLIFVMSCLTFDFWRRSLPIHRFARPPVCLFQLASGEVSLTILTPSIIGEYCRVFYNNPGPKKEQCHTQTIYLFQVGFAAVKNKFGLLIK